MPRTLDDHALDISRHQPALLDQEISGIMAQTPEA
jgi:hypothetical protein